MSRLKIGGYGLVLLAAAIWFGSVEYYPPPAGPPQSIRFGAIALWLIGVSIWFSGHRRSRKPGS
jgi:hypothetical protein